MSKRGRHPQTNPTKPHQSLTLRLNLTEKTMIMEMADGYDLTIKDYLLMLVNRDCA